MNLNCSTPFKWVAAGVLAGCAILVATTASAQVNWSIGIGTPGVVVGAPHPPPVYFQPAPVYTEPEPVYYQPAPRAYYRPPPPVYYRPPPAYYGPPAPVYYEPGYYTPGSRHSHRREREERDDD